MSAQTQATIARGAALAGAVLIVVCATFLFVDDAMARRQAARDDQRIVALQQKAASDASQAPILAADQKRITALLRARQARIRWISIVLMVAAAVFVTGAKRWTALQGRPAVAWSKLVQVTPVPAAQVPASSAPSVPPSLDLNFVDEIVAREGRSREAAIPILQAIQSHYRYLPDEALQRVCELTDVTPAQIAGTSSFYAQFRRTPVGKHVVRVCHGTACHVSGARQITDELRRSLGILEGADTDADRMFTIDEVACVGCCSLAPVLMVDGHTVGKLTPATARDALDVVEPREPA